MTDRIPRAVRPLRNNFLSVAKTISDDQYLDWSEQKFVAELMKNSNGQANPNEASFIYRQLILDAGLEPKTDD